MSKDVKAISAEGLKAYCPNCPPTIRRTKRTGRVYIDFWPLTITESNYSGTGADLASCENCEKLFFLEYRLYSITEAEGF